MLIIIISFHFKQCLIWTLVIRHPNTGKAWDKINWKNWLQIIWGRATQASAGPCSINVIILIRIDCDHDKALSKMIIIWIHKVNCQRAWLTVAAQPCKSFKQEVITKVQVTIRRDSDTLKKCPWTWRQRNAPIIIGLLRRSMSVYVDH